MIEMLMILVVTSILVLLPILQYQKWEQKMLNYQFLSDIESGYHRTQLSAIQSSRRTYVYLTKAQDVTFVYFDLNGGQLTESHDWPNTMSIAGDVTILFTSNSGSPNKASTFVLVDSLNNLKITYTVQLGSGKLVKKVENL